MSLCKKRDVRVNYKIQKKILKENELIVIKSNEKHSGTALTDCELIDVFAPAREEYKNK